jgi:hypothetical protein
MNDKNYFEIQPNELSYIIAPGSWVMDVRNALGPRKYHPGSTPQERTIRLAPFQNAQNAFTPGDPIVQPAGPTPWTPTSYRSRNVNLFPPLMPGSCFVAENLGPTTMKAGLVVDDTSGGLSLADVLQKQKDGRTPFGAGIEIQACTNYGVYIGGPVQTAAIGLGQFDGNKKLISWLSANAPNAKITSIYADPASGDFTIETSGNINLSLKGTIQQSGLSATSVAAKNLRGIGVPVAGKSSEKLIEFPVATPEQNASYTILTECDWLTETAVQNKTPNGFTVKFATAAPDPGGHLDWLLVR